MRPAAARRPAAAAGAGERVPSRAHDHDRAARRRCAARARARSAAAHAARRDRRVVGVAVGAEEDDLVERREVAPADAHERAGARGAGGAAGAAAGEAPDQRRRLPVQVGGRRRRERACARPTRAPRRRRARCRRSGPAPARAAARRPAARPSAASASAQRAARGPRRDGPRGRTDSVFRHGRATADRGMRSSRRPTGLADGLALLALPGGDAWIRPGAPLRALRFPRSVLPRTDSAGVMNRREYKHRAVGIRPPGEPAPPRYHAAPLPRARVARSVPRP